MKKIILWMGLAFSVVTLVGCQQPNEPTPVTPACQLNHTGVLVARNNSLSTAYVITIGGTSYATLRAGESTGNITLAAGTPHLLGFTVAGTSRAACTASLVTLTQCATTIRTCSS